MELDLKETKDGKFSGKISDNQAGVKKIKGSPFRIVKKLPRLIYEILRYQVVMKILNWRNRPAKILKYPHRKLTKISVPVDFNKISYKKRLSIFQKMNASLLRQSYGTKLGIAAPQIGINLRMMIVNGVPIINPEWTPTKAPKEAGLEGCYSLPPKARYRTERSQYGWAKWYNMDGKLIEYKIKGLQAIVFQHELDHLSGLCCNKTGELVAPPEDLPVKK